MDFLINNLEENTKKIALLKALPLYEFFLSIEKAYKSNEDLVAFSYKYNSEYTKSKIEKMESDVDFNLFNGSLKVFPIDEDGIETFLIKDKGLPQISMLEHKYYSKDKDLIVSFRNDFLNILKEFSLLENRELRFEIYAKYLHGKMPGYRKIIEQWKNNQTENIVKENFADMFSLKESNSINLDNHIENIQCTLDKYLFMLSFAKKKEIFATFPEVESFCEGIEVDRAYNESILKITGKGSRYEKELSNEDHLYISSVAYDEKTYKIKERFSFDDFIRNIETKSNSLFSDSLFLDFFKISKEEASRFDAMLEKETLMKTINNKVDNNENTNKKRL